MSREEFENLSPMEQDNLVTLNGERKALIDEYFWNENLTDEEYINKCQPLYIEQAIESGIITE